MNLLQLADVLEQADIGVKGETIFVNNMPSSSRTAVMLRGKFTGTKIDHELPGFYKTDIMLVVRAVDYAAGETLIERAVVALTLSEKDLSEYYIRYCRPESLPAVYPLSDGDNMEFAVRMNLAFDKK